MHYWLINKQKTSSKLARSHGTTRPLALRLFPRTIGLKGLSLIVRKKPFHTRSPTSDTSDSDQYTPLCSPRFLPPFFHVVLFWVFDVKAVDLIVFGGGQYNSKYFNASSRAAADRKIKGP